MSAVDAPPQARELTPEEQQARAELCRSIEVGIVQDLTEGRTAMWRLAQHCYEFNQEEGWSALGYESQNEWLAQPEIGMSRAQYMRLVRMYRELVVFRQIPEETLAGLDHSKLGIVMPVIEANAKPLDEILDDVRTMGARDLRETYIGVSPPSQDGKVDEHEPTKEEKAATKAAEQLNTSASIVDSWIEMGGDRRRASRHWERLLEDHPFFQALAEVNRTLGAEEGAIPRADLGPYWRGVVKTLKFKLSED